MLDSVTWAYSIVIILHNLTSKHPVISPDFYHLFLETSAFHVVKSKKREFIFEKINTMLVPFVRVEK